MKKKNNYFLILIILLVVGFAAVSTTLVMKGIIGINSKEDDFDVVFTTAMIDNLVVSSQVISEDMKTINYTGNKLDDIGESTVLTYTVLNNSTQYDADVSINCVYPKSDKYTVEITPTSFYLEAGKQDNGTITVTLNKALLEDETISLVCSLEANAMERNTSVDRVLDRTVYDTVLIGDSIMNGYGNDDKSFDYYLKQDKLATNVYKLARNGSMLFSSEYVDKENLILDNQIRKQLFRKAKFIEKDALIIMNGGINDIAFNLQYDSYELGITSEEELSSPTFFNDVMSSDNLIRRIYDSLSGVSMTFPDAKIIYIKPRLIPLGTTAEYYKDIELINNDIILFNKAIDLWESKIGSSSYSNVDIIDANDYVLESDLRYSVKEDDGLHWLSTAYEKIYEQIKVKIQ